MTTVTIPKSEYMNLVQRQRRIEKKLDFLEKVVIEDDERYIRPSVLKRWDRISKDLDKGKGTRFLSVKEAKKFLDKL